MKPPHRSGPEGGDDRRHVQLGRIVRKGLEPTYDGPAESQTAERLYRQANRYGRQPGQRLWPMVLAGFGKK